MFFSLCVALLMAIEPWGKDADLCHKKQVETPLPPQSIVQKVARAMIRFHQEVISPADGPRSNYYPTSSSYTLQAIEKHGFVDGFMLGCDRLMRENQDPWIYSTIVNKEGCKVKFDPVP